MESTVITKEVKNAHKRNIQQNGFIAIRTNKSFYYAGETIIGKIMFRLN